MDVSLLQIAGSLGVGAFLGALIFICYRIDRKSTEKRILFNATETEKRIHDVHKANSDRLEHLLEQDQESRQDNTKAITELIILITRLNGRLK